MESLSKKLYKACKEAKAQEIEIILQKIEIKYPQEYRNAKQKACNYLKIAQYPQEIKERIEKELRMPIEEMPFEALIEIAITILSILPEENNDQNEQGNI